MTVAALTAPNRFVLPEGLPDGTHWPTPDTVVLRNRPLRNGVSLSALSRFADDRWDLNPAIFEDHARSQTLNFEIVCRGTRERGSGKIFVAEDHRDGELG